MHVHAPAHATYSVPGRLLALAYTAVVVVLVLASVAVLAERSGVLGAPDATAQTIAPTAVRSLQVAGYELQVGSLPTRIGEQTAVSVGLSRAGRAVSGARVRITFTMPAMPGMRGLSMRLRQTAPGVYTAAAPTLTVGTWRASVQVTPRHANRFGVGFTHRVSV